MLLKEGSDMDIFIAIFRFFSEHSLCRAFANIWYLDAFLVFDKEALLCSLSEPSRNIWSACSKYLLLWKFPEKNA